MAAAFAAFVGAYWALQYLLETSWGFGAISGGSLWDVVTGERHGLGENTPEILAVVVTRSIVGFGFAWLPLALLSRLVRRIGRRGKPTFDDDNEELGDERGETLLDTPIANVRPSKPAIILPRWAIFVFGLLIILVFLLATVRLMQ